MIQLQPVPLPIRYGIFRTAEMPRYVHFLTSGVASVVTALPGGDAVEVGIIGREGIPEAYHLLGPQVMEAESFMQVDGTGLRMDFRRFREEFETRTELRRCVLRFVQHQAFLTAQLAACNRLHDVEERLARWLLMVFQRHGRSPIQLTQEFLAEMIGARRSTVSIAAGTLQRAGMIEYRRGLVHILDVQALEQAACECLPITQRLFEHIYD